MPDTQPGDRVLVDPARTMPADPVLTSDPRVGEGQGDMNRRPLRKLFKIGEVMHYTGLSRQTIHNYTMLGLITEEERTPSGHRLYGESVFYRLERIQRLKREMSLKQVREALERGDE